MEIGRKPGGGRRMQDREHPADGGDCLDILPHRRRFHRPLRTGAAIAYEVPARTSVVLTVHDPAGRTVRTLVDSAVEAGKHTVIWDGRNDGGSLVASGVYLVRIAAGNMTDEAKIVLAR